MFLSFKYTFITGIIRHGYALFLSKAQNDTKYWLLYYIVVRGQLYRFAFAIVQLTLSNRLYSPNRI